MVLVAGSWCREIVGKSVGRWEGESFGMCVIRVVHIDEDRTYIARPILSSKNASAMQVK
jgi:hypothetical protein